MPIITDDDRKRRQARIAAEKRAAEARRREEVERFIHPSTVKSIVDEVVDEVTRHFDATGEYPDEVALVWHGVTEAVAGSKKCLRVLDTALRDLDDFYYAGVELRAPKATWYSDVYVSTYDDTLAAKRTIFVRFKPGEDDHA